MLRECTRIIFLEYRWLYTGERRYRVRMPNQLMHTIYDAWTGKTWVCIYKGKLYCFSFRSHHTRLHEYCCYTYFTKASVYVLVRTYVFKEVTNSKMGGGGRDGYECYIIVNRAWWLTGITHACMGRFFLIALHFWRYMHKFKSI